MVETTKSVTFMHAGGHEALGAAAASGLFQIVTTVLKSVIQNPITLPILNTISPIAPMRHKAHGERGCSSPSPPAISREVGGLQGIREGLNGHVAHYRLGNLAM